MQLVVSLGGILKSSVSGKTDYRIVGEQDETIVGEDGLRRSKKKHMNL
jgi:DNA polymerase-3 subunit epsilon